MIIMHKLRRERQNSAPIADFKADLPISKPPLNQVANISYFQRQLTNNSNLQHSPAASASVLHLSPTL